MKLSIGILSGGKNSRMGQDKALLTMNNKTFIHILCDELHSFDEVLISVDKKDKYQELPYKMVVDEHKEIGPIEGICQIISHAQNEYVFICAADMPFVKRELVEYMMQFVSSDFDCYVLREKDRIHPLCAIYSKRALPAILELIEKGQYKLLKIFEKVRTKYIDLSLSCFSPKVVKNINTKEEYVKILTPRIFCVSGIKNSGKTYLIIKLINEFIKDGFRVGVIKHDGHDFEIDREGTDTYRFAAAGAASTAIYSDYKSCIIHYRTKENTAALAESIAALSDLDVIIIEGLKNSSYPKVEVVRKAVSQNICTSPDTLICVASDTELSDLSKEIPIVDLNDIKAVYDCINSYFGV